MKEVEIILAGQLCLAEIEVLKSSENKNISVAVHKEILKRKDAILELLGAVQAKNKRESSNKS